MAMACGLPVISLKNQCTTEQLGRSAVLLEEVERTSFIRAMKDAKDQPGFRLQLRALGLHLASAYSLTTCTQQMTTAFAEIIEEDYIPDDK